MARKIRSATQGTCPTVLNDASRLALHEGHYDYAVDCAQMRLYDAPWELTAHANLILGCLAKGDIESVEQHIAQCSNCLAHCDPGLEREKYDTNALLTAAISIYHLTIAKSGSLRHWAQEALVRALEQIAPGRDPWLATNLIINALDISRRSGEESNEIQSWIWESISRDYPRLVRREVDALQRVFLAARGASQANQSFKTEPIDLPQPTRPQP